MYRHLGFLVVPFLLLLPACGSADAETSSAEQGSELEASAAGPTIENFSGTLELWYSRTPEIIQWLNDHRGPQIAPRTCGSVANFDDHHGRLWRIRQSCSVQSGEFPQATMHSHLVAEMMSNPAFAPIPLIDLNGRIISQTSTFSESGWGWDRRLVPHERHSRYVAIRFLTSVDGEIVVDWDTGRSDHPRRFSIEPDENGLVNPGSAVRGGMANPEYAAQPWGELVSQCESAVLQADRWIYLLEADRDTISNSALFDEVRTLQSGGMHNSVAGQTSRARRVKEICDLIQNETPHPFVWAEARWNDRLLDTEDTFAASSEGNGFAQ